MYHHYLSRSLLVLVVLAGLSKSLGLQTLDQILVFPTELGRKITQSDEVAVRSIQLIIINNTIIIFQILPQVGHTVSIGHNHLLDLGVLLRNSLVAAETIQSLTTAGGLVGNHSTDSALEDLSRSTVVAVSTSRVGVHGLAHESLVTDGVSHHYT